MASWGRLLMITRQKKRTNRARLIAPVMALLVFGYFGSQAFQGDYGMRAQIRLEKKAAVLQKRLVRIRSERQVLENRVALLRDGSIEKDMLDEQVRRHLGFVHADDIIIRY